MLKLKGWQLIRKIVTPRTCVPNGCGHQQPNHLDDKCLICRLPMKGNPHESQS